MKRVNILWHLSGHVWVVQIILFVFRIRANEVTFGCVSLCLWNALLVAFKGTVDKLSGSWRLLHLRLKNLLVMQASKLLVVELHLLNFACFFKQTVLLNLSDIRSKSFICVGEGLVLRWAWAPHHCESWFSTAAVASRWSYDALLAVVFHNFTEFSCVHAPRISGERSFPWAAWVLGGLWQASCLWAWPSISSVLCHRLRVSLNLGFRNWLWNWSLPLIKILWVVHLISIFNNFQRGLQSSNHFRTWIHILIRKRSRTRCFCSQSIWSSGLALQ